jgi:RNA polymerase sigma factor (sigma-70 family)
MEGEQQIQQTKGVKKTLEVKFRDQRERELKQLSNAVYQLFVYIRYTFNSEIDRDSVNELYNGFQLVLDKVHDRLIKNNIEYNCINKDNINIHLKKYTELRKPDKNRIILLNLSHLSISFPEEYKIHEVLKKLSDFYNCLSNTRWDKNNNKYSDFKKNLNKQREENTTEIATDPAYFDLILDENNQIEETEEKIDLDILRNVITNGLYSIKKAEAEVINLRYGLDDEKGKTLKEIGDVLGVTRKRVRQIEYEAFRKLQQPKRKKLLEFFKQEKIDFSDNMQPNIVYFIDYFLDDIKALFNNLFISFISCKLDINSENYVFKKAIISYINLQLSKNREFKEVNDLYSDLFMNDINKIAGNILESKITIKKQLTRKILINMFSLTEKEDLEELDSYLKESFRAEINQDEEI